MIKGYKGFDKDLKCRDYQYEVGKGYEEKSAQCCEPGFHFCENPMDVFGYYPPADSRYCEVEGDGEVDRDGDDSKVAVSKIKIGAELGLSGIIQAGVKFILEKVDYANAKESNTGDRSAATNTGDWSAATNTGYQSAASVEGKHSVAIAIGYEGKSKACKGSGIVLAERDDEGNLLHLKCAIAGQDIKPDTYYTLEDGEFVEA